jgi:hypothetical protein
MERKLRGIAGSFILISLLLAHYLHPAWLWFTAFVGLNLLQSAFTRSPEGHGLHSPWMNGDNLLAQDSAPRAEKDLVPRVLTRGLHELVPDDVAPEKV